MANGTRPAGLRPTLVVDLGAATVAAMLVTERGSWLVPDPVSGEGRWPSAIHWDGRQMVAGAAAVARAHSDPAGYCADVRRTLTHGSLLSLGARRLRPGELVAEFLGALRAAAWRLLPSRDGAPAPDRVVVTVPAGAADGLRREVVGAAEAAGFSAVELLPDALGAVWAPGSPLRVGDLVLVYDGGATFAATLVRVGEDVPEVLGHASIVDWSAGGRNGWPRESFEPPAAAEPALACCQDLLAGLGVSAGHVAWALPVNAGARASGLGPMIEQGLGIAVAMIDEPELAVVRGAAAWLRGSGARSVLARGSDQRLVPLAYTIPGGTARLLRWLVEPQRPYGEGAAVARVRLSSGAVWDLTVRGPGALDEVLVPGGRDIRSGEWLALVRPA